MGTTWAGQPNGQISLSKMVAVEGFYFEPLTAQCVAGLLAAARKAGYYIAINQGYRALGSPGDSPRTNPPTQWSAYNAMRQGVPLPGAAVVASAAYPGTSNHGDGTASDFQGTGWHPYTPLSTWLAGNARDYGIEFDVPSESWHGHRKYPPLIALAELNKTPLEVPPPEQEEDDMPIQITVIDSTGKYSAAKEQHFALVGEGLTWATYTDARRANNVAAYMKRPVAIPCTYDDWEYYMRLAGGTNPIA